MGHHMFVFQAYCTGPSGREHPSLGRRRREADENEYSVVPSESVNATDEEEHLREMIEVKSHSTLKSLLSLKNNLHIFINIPQVCEDPFDIPERKEEMQRLVNQQEVPTVCLTNREYYSMIAILFIFMGLMITVTITAGIYYK